MRELLNILQSPFSKDSPAPLDSSIDKIYQYLTLLNVEAERDVKTYSEAERQEVIELIFPDGNNNEDEEAITDKLIIRRHFELIFKELNTETETVNETHAFMLSILIYRICEDHFRSEVSASEVIKYNLDTFFLVMQHCLIQKKSSENLTEYEKERENSENQASLDINQLLSQYRSMTYIPLVETTIEELRDNNRRCLAKLKNRALRGKVEELQNILTQSLGKPLKAKVSALAEYHKKLCTFAKENEAYKNPWWKQFLTCAKTAICIVLFPIGIYRAVSTYNNYGTTRFWLSRYEKHTLQQQKKVERLFHPPSMASA